MNARNTALALGLACVAGLSPLVLAQSRPQSGRTPLDAHRTLGQPQRFRNLTLIPVYDTRATTGDDYLTLDEGLKSGLVTVKESSTGGEVNTLYLTNKSRRPLYLMAGEVVLGGQQDRTIGNDSIVSAGTKRLPITVFCVEHGRWTGQQAFAMSAKTVASAEIRASAQNGAFYNEVANAAPASVQGTPGMMGRTGMIGGRPGPPANLNAGAGFSAVGQRAVSATNNTAAMIGNVTAGRPSDSLEPVGNAQQQVWDRVAAKNRHFKTETESGTYRNLLNLSGGEAGRSINPYIKAFSAGLPADAHLVGAVAAVNGKVVAADIFGNTTLFRKLWPKLLRSYAADAAEHNGAKQQTVSAVEAARFLHQAAEGRDRIQARSVTGVNTRLVTAKAITYGLASPAPKPAAQAASPALHENVLSK